MDALGNYIDSMRLRHARLTVRQMALWHYLAVRPDARPQFIDRVFLTSEGRSMERNAVGKVLARLRRRVGVQANPHKFRHTGATLFLRNGGNAFTLKEILGHSTMAMVERYVHLAQVDIEEAHRRASPQGGGDQEPGEG